MKINNYEIKYDATIHLVKFMAAIEASDAFEGRTAQTDRNVMRALIYLAQERGAYTINPGSRKVSEIAGHCRKTVERAILRLEKKGWIKRTWRAHPMDGRATRIRLCWEKAIDLKLPIRNDVLLNEITLWSGDCLGGNARAVYQSLIHSEGELKKKSIQELTKLGYKPISKALGVLLGEKLVLQVGRRYSAIRYLESAEARYISNKILDRWGVNVKIQRRMATHKFERQVRGHLLKYSKSFQTTRIIALTEHQRFIQMVRPLG